MVATLAACSDTPIATALPSTESAGLLGEIVKGARQATVLKRTIPLDADESVTRTIGPLGGTIALPGAGLTLTFPPLALRQPTAITLLAPAGDLVGYHFEPHGLEFRVPVLAVQHLDGTEVPLLEGLLGIGLYAGYFEDELAPVVHVLETLPLHPVGTGGAGVFHLTHFSGYVIATN